MSTALDDVAARYARRPRPRLRVIVVIVGVLLAGTVFVTVTGSVLEREVRWQDVSFDVVSSDLVEVTFEVYGNQGERFRCQVRATDARFGDVGQVDVDTDAVSARGIRLSVPVRTVARASSASVRTCVLLP